MRRGCQAIERVITVVVRAATIGHLGNVIDRVELILKISQRVGAFRVR
jgi:hypothetical protein